MKVSNGQEKVANKKFVLFPKKNHAPNKATKDNPKCMQKKPEENKNTSSWLVWEKQRTGIERRIEIKMIGGGKKRKKKV